MDKSFGSAKVAGLTKRRSLIDVSGVKIETEGWRIFSILLI